MKHYFNIYVYMIRITSNNLSKSSYTFQIFDAKIRIKI